MAAAFPRILLVEGKTEERVIPELMEHYVEWPNDKNDPNLPARIKEVNGIENLLAEGTISTEIKVDGRECVGVLIDADDAPQSRWDSIRKLMSGMLVDLPDTMPRYGHISQTYDGIRFGVWVMPDCISDGMLESFIGIGMIDTNASLWPHTHQFVQNAKDKHKAPFTDSHHDKAMIHAWLAVQEPPGLQLHEAIINQQLVPNSAMAEDFAHWFCELFQCRRRVASTTSNV